MLLIDQYFNSINIYNKGFPNREGNPEGKVSELRKQESS